MKSDYAVGDVVRLVCDVLAGTAGTEGTVMRIIRDEQQQITALDIFIDGDPLHVRGTTVFLHEVELVRHAASAPTG
jgi:hypothetical protein